ncbi:MAG: PKD domain-containing protein [Bacteroidota bacterium]
MKKLLPLLFFLGTTCLWMPSLHATHYAGTDVYYECTGPTTIDVYTTIYYDCEGSASQIYLPVGSSTSIPINNGIVMVNPVQPNCTPPFPLGQWEFDPNFGWTEVTPLCPNVTSGCDPTILNPDIAGTIAARVKRSFDFSGTSCDLFQVTFSTCCRPGDITSIAQPANAATFLKPTIIDLSVTPCNNAPVPPKVSQFYVCQNTDTYLDMASVDPDGDSLVYRLDTCYGENNGLPLNYNPGYSPTAPLGIFWNVSIESSTGLVNVTSTNTISPEVGVVCVAIDEYRNGTYLATHYRDYQIRTISCFGARPVLASSSVSGSANLQADTLKICETSLLSLSFEFADADTLDTLVLDTILTPHTVSNVQVSGSNPILLTLDLQVDSSALLAGSSLNISISDNTCPIVRTELFSWVLQKEDICLLGNVNDADCGQSNGSISLNLIGLQGPFNYLWSTGDTSSSIQNLSPGNYWVDVTDGSGGFYTDTFQIASGDIVLAENITKPNCNTNDGIIALTAANGNPPYTYQWNTGDTTSTIDSLAAGGYSVIVTDDSGCVAQKTFILQEVSICTYDVSGYAYLDLNGNCVFDSNETAIANQWIDFTPGGAVLTDANGFYSYAVPPLSYNVSYGGTTTFQDLCNPSGINVTVSNADITGIDFGLQVIPPDPEVVISAFGLATTVGPFTYNVQVTNPDTAASSGTLKVVLDSSMQLSGTTPTPTSISGDTLIWNYSQVPAASFANFTLDFAAMPPSTLGDTLCITACIFPDGLDDDTTNNLDIFKRVVLGAYDPNIKVPNPLGTGPLGLMPADQLEHTYQIYFQNTGTFPALYVTIRDTISGPLVPSTLRPLSSSHPYTVVIEEDSILVFTFANINLPDSASDPTGSIGHINYRMAHEPGLPAGTIVRNRAAIFFDFNPPIFTPWAENTLYRDFTINFPDIAGFVCEGDVLTADLASEGLAPYTFTWDNQTGNVEPDLSMELIVGQDTGYVLTVTDALGIQSKLEVELPLAPAPDAQFSFSQNARSFDFSAPADDVFSYEWDFGDNIGTATDSNPSYTYGVDGSFIVTLIVTSPCGTDTTTQLVNTTNVSIDDALNGPRISPVPFGETLWIDMGQEVVAPIEIRLINLQGEVIQLRENVRTTTISLATSDLAQGIYFVEIKMGDKRWIEKVRK